MIQKEAFLRWIFLLSLIVITLVIVADMEFIGYVWDHDITKISFGIFALFVGITLKCGAVSWKTSSLIDNHRQNPTSNPSAYREHLNKISNQVNVAIFAENMCILAGFFGTMAGLTLMFYFGADEIQNASSKLSDNTMDSFSAVFLTSLTGMACSAMLSLQCLNLTYAIAEEKDGQ